MAYKLLVEMIVRKENEDKKNPQMKHASTAVL